MTEASIDISAPVLRPLAEEIYRTDFEITREMPPALRSLVEISANFYWSWQSGGARLFRDIDATLWDRCEQNPRLFLKKVSSVRLWQKALDAEYVGRLDRLHDEFRNYLEENPETGGVDKPSSDHPVAYFCAEYGVHQSLPNYSGGLGILAGDHLKSASDLNVPLVAVGLLYRYGYFRQRISHDGWQLETYNDVFASELAVTPLFDEDGKRVTVSVHIRDREVFAQAWHAVVGRISLYLLDTNVERNDPTDRLITGHLYGGDVETRIVQEKVLGIGGVRLLRRLRIDPSVFHLNEGHAAFSTLELCREHLEKNSDDDFADAAAAVKPQCVFTTHTPVAAGNDVFAPDKLSACFSEEFVSDLKLTEQEFLALGRADLSDGTESFGMTPLALRMCRSANGVSAKHGEVSRNLWLKMFPDLADASAVPITSITNGVHAPTWIAPNFQQVFAKATGPDWRKDIANADVWAENIRRLSDEDIWRTHCDLKNLLIAFVRERTRAKETGSVETINEREDTWQLCSPDALTIGFARRVAAYKRWDLIFSDLPRLLKMVDDAERPVQFIFAGKAHPQDRIAKGILQELMSIDSKSNWQNRAVFIEDYDQEVARYLVQGVDVWMNVPRRPMEASGTSGMKAAMNGVLNFSVLDGWWVEGFNLENGFAIGDLREDLTEEEMDAVDAEAMYSTLENAVVPSFYERDEQGLPRRWIAMMRNSLATLTPKFSSDRMVAEYLDRIYKG